MFNEYLVNKCLIALCSIESSRPQSKELLESINKIFDYYRKSTTKDDIPTIFKDKIDLIIGISQKRLKDGLSIDDIIGRLRTGKFKEMVPLLEASKQILSDSEYQQTFKDILEQRKVCEIFGNKSDFRELLDDLDSGNYTDVEEISTRWEKQLTMAHRNLSEVLKIESIGKVSSLDVQNDDITPVMQKIRDSIDNSETISLGYPEIESLMMAEGFEPNRFYLIAGSSGVGKSALLINFIANACLKKKSARDECQTFLYITAENLIYETFERFYCCLTAEPHKALIERIKRNKELAETFLMNNDPEGYQRTLRSFDVELFNRVKVELDNRGVNVIFKYVKARRTSTKEVESIIDSVAQEHGDLKAVFIDYLNLFKTGLNLELRHELGQIAQDFKNMAVGFGLPVISATQLNRSGYDTNQDASLTQTGESMQMIDNADFVLFLQNTKNPTLKDHLGQKISKKVRVTVLKNRRGAASDQSINYQMPLKNGDVDIFNFRIESIPKGMIAEEEEEDSYGYSSYPGSNQYGQTRRPSNSPSHQIPVAGQLTVDYNG